MCYKSFSSFCKMIFKNHLCEQQISAFAYLTPNQIILNLQYPTTANIVLNHYISMIYKKDYYDAQTTNR